MKASKEASQRVSDARGWKKIEQLIEIFEAMDPYLDRNSSAFCVQRSPDLQKTFLHRLDSAAVEAVVKARMFSKHSINASLSEIRDARMHVVGRLWEQTESWPSCDASSLVELVAKVAREQEQWRGTVTDLVTLIKAQLPEDADAAELSAINRISVGKTLGKIVFDLKSLGIKAYRPKRRAKERTWVLRVMTSPPDPADISVTDEGRTCHQTKGPISNDVTAT